MRVFAVGLLMVLVADPIMSQQVRPGAPVDSAAWGSDHVAKQLPQYMTGDECLFCHRQVGATWGENAHQLTIRPAAPADPALQLLRQREGGEEIARQTRYLMGSRAVTRFLKRSEAYGKLVLLNASYRPSLKTANQGNTSGDGTLSEHRFLKWEKTTFADRCAGCHATAVDAKTRAFSTASLDCFVCHGLTELDHAKNASKVLLSNEKTSARHVASICGQCHLRGGRSKSTGLNYPNQFVPGDNLFRDFQVDLSEQGVAGRRGVEHHIFVNTKRMVRADDATTCLSCHDVHAGDSSKHQNLPVSTICHSCHQPGGDNMKLRQFLRPEAKRRARSTVCDY